MARVLLAWELGGNSGHIVRLAGIAEQLLARGHSVDLVLQRPDALRQARQLLDRVTVRQAPIWPGQLQYGGQLALPLAASYGDILANFGMTDSGMLEFLLRAWDQLYADARPDIIVGDFAPAAILAARGRLPTVAVGTGYTVPPSHLQAFPVFHPERDQPNVAEAQLLAVANRALERFDRALLDRLPAMAAADRLYPAVFAELDPYATHRPAPPLPPFLNGGAAAAEGGDALFAYLPFADMRGNGERVVAAIVALAREKVPILAHLPGLPPALAQQLVDAGVALHARKVPPAEIAAQARLVLSSAGMGLVSTALVMGLPMALLPSGIEQRLTALAVEKLGTGRILDASDMASQLHALWADAALAAAARTQAPGFRARLGNPQSLVADGIEQMFDAPG